MGLRKKKKAEEMPKNPKELLKLDSAHVLQD